VIVSQDVISQDNTGFLVMKFKVSGQKQWERRLTSDVIDIGIDGIAQTRDGGFVLVGGCKYNYIDDCGFEPPSGAILIKLRPNGTVGWKKSFAVNGYGFARFSSVIATSDGGVIAIGQHPTDLLHLLNVRVNATGDVVWKKSFELPVDFFGSLVKVSSTATPDDGFIVAFNFYRPYGVGVMKITNSGKVVWKKRLLPGFNVQSVGVTKDGGAVLFSGAANKLKVVVLNANGTLSWNAGYSLKVQGTIRSVSRPVQTPDDGYVVTGSTSYGRKNSGFIAKIDSSRKVAFQRTFGNGLASGESIFTTPDGGFFLFGTTPRRSDGEGGIIEADILVLKMNSEGIVPGCDFFHSSGTATTASYGQFTIDGDKLSRSVALSIESFDFGLTSVASNHPVSTVCR